MLQIESVARSKTLEILGNDLEKASAEFQQMVRDQACFYVLILSNILSIERYFTIVALHARFIYLLLFLEEEEEVTSPRHDNDHGASLRGSRTCMS